MPRPAVLIAAGALFGFILPRFRMVGAHKIADDLLEDPKIDALIQAELDHEKEALQASPETPEGRCKYCTQ